MTAATTYPPQLSLLQQSLQAQPQAVHLPPVPPPTAPEPSQPHADPCLRGRTSSSASPQPARSPHTMAAAASLPAQPIPTHASRSGHLHTAHLGSRSLQAQSAEVPTAARPEAALGRPGSPENPAGVATSAAPPPTDLAVGPSSNGVLQPAMSAADQGDVQPQPPAQGGSARGVPEDGPVNGGGVGRAAPPQPLPAQIVVVNSAAELRRAIAAAARDIEIHSHLDLRALTHAAAAAAPAAQAQPQLRGYGGGGGGVQAPYNTQRGLPAIKWPTRSIRVCAGAKR